MAPDTQRIEAGIILHDEVVFPRSVNRVRVSDDCHVQGDFFVALYANDDGVSSVGVLCELIDDYHTSNQRHMLIEGLDRVVIRWHRHQEVMCDGWDPPDTISDDVRSLATVVYDFFKKQASFMSTASICLDTLLGVITPDQPGDLVDTIAAYLPIPYSEKVKIIESLDLHDRLSILRKNMNQLSMDAHINEHIDHSVQKTMNKERKEWLLKAKLRAIQAELNIHTQSTIVSSYVDQLTAISLTEHSHNQLMSDIQRLDQYPDDSTEYALITAYLDVVFSIPWGKKNRVNINIKRVKSELNAHHFGLESVKMRIMEHLAVRKISKKRVGTVLCLSGPPGVGKTSIVRSIAMALRRSFVHIPLGGIHDEAELRGHRRTYVGAMPGKIISGIIKAGMMNPVVCLDEVDKLVGGFKGNSLGVLLEILDIEQNKSFIDNYIQCPVDLSLCMFVCTANDLSIIPKPLLDRMEIISIDGYTIDQKVTVAKHYIFPSICRDLGLPISDTCISDEGWDMVVRQYTSDVGLRELRHVIHKLCRKTALRLLEKQPIPDEWSNQFLQNMLGPGVSKPIRAINPHVGQSTVIMLQSMVGYCCAIETQMYKGPPGFTASSNISPNIEDAIRLVFGILKIRFHDYAIDPSALFEHHFHIHFQHSMVGISDTGWGLGIFVSIISRLLNIALPGTLTFCAELSLSGQLRPVGTISQRLLSGAHLGVRQLIVSSMESPTLDESTTQIIPLDTIDDVVSLLVKWYL